MEYMEHDEIARIAEQVSILMQLDRTRHQVPTDIENQALANVPAYVASVFEEANKVRGPMSPEESYAMINKRVSQIQAQLYLMRLELENRTTRDPASIYEDPLAISAYGERFETIVRPTRSFSFEADILAYGWYTTERPGDGESRRWMRPGDVSVACVPHLGAVDQVIEVSGYVLTIEQLDTLEIRVGETLAVITQNEPNSKHFTACLTLSGDELKSANYAPIEFRVGDFEQPNASDTRLLGANVGSFLIKPSENTASEKGSVEPTDADSPAQNADGNNAV